MVLVLPGLALIALAATMVLTGTGARRRGAGWVLATGSAIASPITWAAWYVRDEHPGGRYRWPRAAV